MGQLCRSGQRADGGDERSDAQRGVEGGQQQSAVGRQNAYARAFSGTHRQQCARHAGGELVEFAVTERLAGEDEGGVVGARRDHLGEQLRERRRRFNLSRFHVKSW
jgi:hypothetical protein